MDAAFYIGIHLSSLLLFANLDGLLAYPCPPFHLSLSSVSPIPVLYLSSFLVLLSGIASSSTVKASNA